MLDCICFLLVTSYLAGALARPRIWAHKGTQKILWIAFGTLVFYGFLVAIDTYDKMIFDRAAAINSSIPKAAVIGGLILVSFICLAVTYLTKVEGRTLYCSVLSRATVLAKLEEVLTSAGVKPLRSQTLFSESVKAGSSAIHLNRLFGISRIQLESKTFERSPELLEAVRKSLSSAIDTYNGPGIPLSAKVLMGITGVVGVLTLQEMYAFFSRPPTNFTPVHVQPEPQSIAPPHDSSRVVSIGTEDLRLTNVSCHTTPEGDIWADLECHLQERKRPADTVMIIAGMTSCATDAGRVEFPTRWFRLDLRTDASAVAFSGKVPKTATKINSCKLIMRYVISDQTASLSWPIVELKSEKSDVKGTFKVSVSNFKVVDSDTAMLTLGVNAPQTFGTEGTGRLPDQLLMTKLRFSDGPDVDGLIEGGSWYQRNYKFYDLKKRVPTSLTVNCVTAAHLEEVSGELKDVKIER